MDTDPAASQPSAPAVSPVPSPAERPYISNPFKLIAPSYRALRVNGKALLVMFGAMAVLVAALIGAIFAPASAVRNALLVAVVTAFVVFALLLIPAMTLILLKAAKGERIGFGEAIRQGRPFVWRLLGVYLLTGLAVFGGVLLFIIPGLIFGAWFMSAPYLALEEDLGVIASMKRSKRLVKGHVFEMLGLQGMGWVFSMLGIIPILGTLAGFVLQIITMPALAIRTLQLRAAENQPTRTHWVNYVIVLALPVLIVIAMAFGALSDKNESRFIDDQPQFEQEFQDDDF